jgi:YNFM family putative membrane transporter
MDHVSTDALMRRSRNVAFKRSLVIALTAFFTLVDLFATQAILPSLTEHYEVSPAAMGLAVNSSTFGMAAAGLAY